MQENAIVRTLARQEGLDRIASPVQGVVDGALTKIPVLKKALKGTSWLGHALHPALTDFPIGAWGAGVVLDILESQGGTVGRRRYRDGADAVHLFGFVTACMAAVTGLADYTEAGPRARRVGIVHGLLNVGVLGLYGASLMARKRGRRRSGMTLSNAGFGLLLFSGWLGRELAYSYGLGQTAERQRPAREAMPVTEPVREPGRYEIETPSAPSDEIHPVTH